MNPALPKHSQLNIPSKGGANFADLHLHTACSDGTYTPVRLVNEAVKAGLSAISIVDHDTVEAIQPAIEAGQVKGIEIIPGIELSAEFEGKEIHVLGYLIDHLQKSLNNRLAALKQDRVSRIYKIAEKLQSSGINLDAQAVFDIASGGSVGRLHVARALVKKKFVGSIFEAFKKYIGDNCPAYVLGFRFSPQEAIKLIREAGGIPILAHPYTLDKDEMIARFVDCGLMGLEVYYPEHSQAMVNFYLGMAKKMNLLVTGGSDCHGEAKPEVKIGSIKIPYELVEKLKEAKEKLT